MQYQTNEKEGKAILAHVKGIWEGKSKADKKEMFSSESFPEYVKRPESSAYCKYPFVVDCEDRTVFGEYGFGTIRIGDEHKAALLIWPTHAKRLVF